MYLAGSILSNPFIDRKLNCVSCNEEFTFAAGEQTFVEHQKFVNDPKHCKRCKAKRARRKARPETQTVCAECGADITVPFVPKQGRPVLCRVCFELKIPGIDAVGDVNGSKPEPNDDRMANTTESIV